MSQTFTSDIIHLNVGGTKFSTSRQTLTCVQDSFFTSLLSGRIPTCRDETGALFIDRDPKLFSIILNFLRTKEIDVNGVDISVLRHEAEFYGVLPLAQRLSLCEDLDRSLCGDVLFTGFISTPTNLPQSSSSSSSSSNGTNSYSTSINQINNNQTTINKIIKTNNETLCRPGNVMRLNPNNTSGTINGIHSRNSSIDFLINANNKTHSRKSSYEIITSSSSSGGAGGGVTATAPNHYSVASSHSRNQSLDLKQIKTDLGILLNNNNSNNSASNNQLYNQTINNNQIKETNVQVNIITGHHNWIAVAHPHFVTCYKMKDGLGWQLMFQSPYIEEEIDRIAINSKNQTLPANNNNNNANIVNAASSNNISPNSSSSTNNSQTSGNSLIGSSSLGGGGGSNAFNLNTAINSSSQAGSSIENAKLCAVLAIAFESNIRLWLVNDEINTYLINTFSLGASVDHLFFIGSQLVATKCTGKIGVWNSLTQLWQIQDVTPIASFDTAGSFLLLGGQNGIIYYIDMQKFPLRIKDNDLLVTELYKDTSGDAITALSVYLTPKTTNTGNWIEIAYGTSSGNVRVIVQHPETVGHGLQLFQTFSVHRSSITKVMLTEKYLVSVCSEYNHVRTWTVTRFRGMISTQPGSTPLSSFKIVSIDALDAPSSYSAGNDIGPYGEREDQQVFIQKVVPYTDQLFVRLSSTGKRICTIKSVDYSKITSFCVHECDGPSRLNSRPRRYLFSGHLNGTIQMWDLTTALELKPSEQTSLGGPSASEFVRLLDQCDLSVNSGYSTPTTNCLSPCPSLYSFNNPQSSKYFNNKNLLLSSNMNNNLVFNNNLMNQNLNLLNPQNTQIHSLNSNNQNSTDEQNDNKKLNS